MIVIIILSIKIKSYETENYWHSHSRDEQTGAQRGWDFPRQVTNGGTKAQTQERHGRAPGCLSVLLLFHSPLYTLPFSLTALLSVLFLKHIKSFPAQGHQPYCSVCQEYPSPLLTELTSCLSCKLLKETFPDHSLVKQPPSLHSTLLCFLHTTYHKWKLSC